MMCSIVEMTTLPSFKVVAIRVSFTDVGLAGISTGGVMSTRRKMMPVSGAAGFIVNRTRRPE